MAHAVRSKERDRKEEMFYFPCNLVLMPVLFFLLLMSIPQELRIGKTAAALNIQASYYSNFSAELHMSLFGLQYCWELIQAEVQTGAKAADKADAFNQHRLHWLFICLRCGDCLWVILNSAVYLPSALSVVLCLCQSLIESFCSQI